MSQPNQVSLQIEDETAPEPTHRVPVNIIRLDSVTRPVLTSRTNLGIGDRLNNVFREIRPLVEHARMGNNARLSLPTWLPRSQPGPNQTTEITIERPQSSIAHVDLGPNTNTFIVTERIVPAASQVGVANSVSNESNLSESNDNAENNEVTPATNNNVHDNVENDSQSDDVAQQIMDMRATLQLLIKYAPFYLILFMKFMYDCRVGLFTFFILFCTFMHSNNFVRRAVHKCRRSLMTESGQSY